MLESALAHIARIQPAQLPDVSLPTVPDLTAAGPLAEIAHGDPRALLDTVRQATEDLSTARSALDAARRLIAATVRDLIGLGFELLQRGLPIALGLLIPNPATQAAARSALQALAMEYVGKAMLRVKQLAGDLLQAAAPLIPIGQRAVRPSVRGPQEEGVVRHALTASSTASVGSTQGQAAAQAALSQVGTPYGWGGTGNGSFDCSGLTQWAWRQAGVELPRTAESQTVGRQVSADELQPGDLIVWDGHVAMYSGGGQMVEAGSPVQTNPLRTNNMGMAFKGFWRPTG
ncbi:NlpC/P60 family protein [Corynebacterium sp. B5-R-101]|uniref:NlpC/P60 family protein n=1 Tax=Corynebacterium intestinale TaxID=2943492 RepID=A0ABT0TBX4_9CORY|nr:C40 family peptidase [Corynebacterium intestinale]MCL8494557.1 NlpC/P60 family protein [Corynebacterium intestinale]MCP1390793.1 NlpC/P60 family protein [Corynebacterium intestinale]